MKTKRISKRIISGILAFTLMLPSLSSFAFAEIDNKTILHKRESVYINSDAYGVPTKLNIYNYFDIANVDEIKDYGVYNKYQVLTGEKTPKVSGDAITWNVNKDDRSFGYIGTSELDYIKNMPWSFDIRYYLNGKETLAKDLLHQSGLVKVVIHVIPNDDAPPAPPGLSAAPPAPPSPTVTLQEDILTFLEVVV